MRSLRPYLASGSRICCVQAFAPRRARFGQREVWTRGGCTFEIDGTRRRSRFLTALPQLRRRFEPWPLAAWKQEVEFSPARVTSNVPAATEVRRVRLDIGEGSRSYSTPGQFVQIRVAGFKPAFLAIASPPGAESSEIDLLVKCRGDTAERLCDLDEGAEVGVSPVMGNGFPIERLPLEEVHHVWMFATGTGIAPIQTVLLSPAFQTSERQSVHLYYGVKNVEASPVLEDIATWENNYPNLDVRVIYSEEGQGYVQDRLENDSPEIDPQHTGVLLCGQREMCEAITQYMTEAGVDQNRILLNF